MMPIATSWRSRLRTVLPWQRTPASPHDADPEQVRAAMRALAQDAQFRALWPDAPLTRPAALVS